MKCKCGKKMKYLVGNGGLEAHWCSCGRALLTDDGEAFLWFEPEKEKEKEDA